MRLGEPHSKRVGRNRGKRLTADLSTTGFAGSLRARVWPDARVIGRGRSYRRDPLVEAHPGGGALVTTFSTASRRRSAVLDHKDSTCSSRPETRSLGSERRTFTANGIFCIPSSFPAPASRGRTEAQPEEGHRLAFLEDTSHSTHDHALGLDLLLSPI